MDDRRPSLLRHAEGRSGTPLLYKPDSDRGRSYASPHRRSSPVNPNVPNPPSSSSSAAAAAPPMPTAPMTPRSVLSRRSTMRSRSPPSNAAVLAARRRYTYAAVFLVVSLFSFTVQTELASWVQHAGWAKPYCMLYLTHGSWSLLWPVQLLVLRLQKRDVPWPVFWRRHAWLIRTSAVMVQRRDLDLPRGYGERGYSPWRYMAKTTAGVTTALTVAGLSWYVAVNMTTPSDLTAIYNCSAFFAYAFSVPLLKERLRLDKSLAVAVAIAGVLVVAYGDGGGGTGAATPKTPTPQPGNAGEGAAVFARVDGGGAGGGGGNTETESTPDTDPGVRFLGNLIIGAGSVLYGLYEVLYKRFACPPDGCSPGRGMIFANTFGSLIGIFTLTVLWIPLPLLHVLGIETFELPTGRVAWYLFLSVVMNATFAGSFLVLISLTSPVLSSVAALLTIFIVALADWVIKREPLSGAAVFGGAMITVAFLMLSWSTYREMTENEEKKKLVDISGSSSDEEDEDGEDSGD